MGNGRQSLLLRICIDELYNMPPKKKSSGSSKSKERKLKRKQEQGEIAAALVKVKAAYEHGDFMAALTPFKTYKRNSLDLTISYCRVGDMTSEDLKWSFNLVKESVKSYYVNSGWGWNDKEKWEEITHDSSCFLLARDAETSNLKAFVNFRFDLDEQVEVLYCYEIHLCPEVRRKGLGKFLMQILELIGHRTNMCKVVLTVFKANTISNSFFRERLNYIDDDTSPLFCDPLYAEEYTYSILSKTLGRKTAPQVARPANQVREVEGGSTAAHKAVHKGTGVSRARKSASSPTSTSPTTITSDQSSGFGSTSEQSGGVATREELEVGQGKSQREQEATVCSEGN